MNLRESNKVKENYILISFHIKDNKIMHLPDSKELVIKSVEITKMQ